MQCEQGQEPPADPVTLFLCGRSAANTDTPEQALSKQIRALNKKLRQAEALAAKAGAGASLTPEEADKASKIETWWVGQHACPCYPRTHTLSRSLSNCSSNTQGCGHPVLIWLSVETHSTRSHSMPCACVCHNPRTCEVEQLQKQLDALKVV